MRVTLNIIPITLFLAFFGLIGNICLAQNEKDKRIAAEELFEDGNYITALPYFLDLLKKDKDNLKLQFMTGVCYLYKSDEKEKAIDYLLKVYEQKPKTKNVLYYLGKAYSLNYKFDEGIEAFSDAMSSNKTAKSFKQSIPRLIESCKNAKILIKSPIDVEIENLGDVINSEWSEYTPLISSDESMMIFTYRGEKSVGGRQDRFGDSNKNGSYFEDIYFTSKEKDKWIEPLSIGRGINSKAHEACISLSSDGQRLYVYKDTKERPGDIYYSDLQEEVWSALVPLPDKINTKYSETSISVSTDGLTMYFSSNRPDGVGGKDIYFCVKNKLGEWSEPQNLGDVVNTEYDDDAVFIHPDGRTLYFSSKGHNSMGGYDIFVTSRASNGKWSAPKNIGYPINTPEDDIYFAVSGNGKNGYYSSGKSGGEGQQDIYVARMDRIASDHFYTMVRGRIGGDDKLINGKVIVRNLETGNEIGEFRSNPITKSYIINLSKGNYELTYVGDGVVSQTKEVVAYDNKFVEQELNVHLLSDGYVPKMNLVGKVDFDNDSLNEKVSKISLTSLDSTINRVVELDSLNNFSHENLPSNLSYKMLVMDVPDETYYKVCGEFSSNLFEKKFENIGVNEVKSDVDGYFEFERIVGPSTNLLVDEIKRDDSEKVKEENENKSRLSSHKKNPWDEDWYNSLLTSIGEKEFRGVHYKVQVGAYFIPRNFNTIAIKSLGEIKALELNDGITRFTMGQFKKLKDANLFRKKLMKAGVRDAFVTVFINGERRLLSEITPEKLATSRTQ